MLNHKFLFALCVITILPACSLFQTSQHKEYPTLTTLDPLENRSLLIKDNWREATQAHLFDIATYSPSGSRFKARFIWATSICTIYRCWTSVLYYPGEEFLDNGLRNARVSQSLKATDRVLITKRLIESNGPDGHVVKSISKYLSPPEITDDNQLCLWEACR